MYRVLLLVGYVIAGFCFGLVAAEGADDFNLAPGEVVTHIDGKPVSGSPPAVQCSGGVCRLASPAVAVVGRHHVRRNAAAYAWCLQEATLCMKAGRSYHPRGNCPGASCTGTGYSHSPDRPMHCCKERGAGRLMARASVRCPRTGRWYWAAAYH